MLRRFCLPMLLLCLLANAGSSDTYPEWKTRVFSPEEQSDPAISGENAAPAGDGISNLLKYALGLDPHQVSTLRLPVVSIGPGIYGGGPGDLFLTLTWRVPSTDPPSDLFYVPEITTDLVTGNWLRGAGAIIGPILEFSETVGAPITFAAQATSPAYSNSATFMRLRLIEGETLPDDWRLANFGNTAVDPDGDVDGDGATNFQEFLNGTDPNDYYNGVTPEIAVVGGDHQIGDPLAFLSLPLTVRMTRGGEPLANAPIQFTVAPGTGHFGLSPTDTQLTSTMTLRTDADGLVAPFFQSPLDHWGTLPVSISGGQATATMTTHTNGGHPAGAATISIVNGDNQSGLPNQYLRKPFVVRFLAGDGQPITSTAITFSLSNGDGGLTPDRFGVSPSSSVTLITNDEGLAWVYYKGGPNSGSISEIAAVAENPAAQATFSTRTVSYALVAPELIATGERHTVACYSDGSAWSWGNNDRGQLGDGTATSHWHREQIVGLTNVIAVSTRQYTSAALRSDGTVWTWGANDGYGLGNGESADSSIPVQVLEDVGAPLANVVAIASGYWHHLALKSDGTVWAWGTDWGYQLGNDSEEDSAYALPVLLPNGSPLQNIAAIACGDDHNLALKADGTVWTWGYNGEAELGNGETGWRSAIPKQVTGLTNVIMISGGSIHSLALKDDGTIWSWGKDSYGSIGDGTIGGKRASPVQVHNLTNAISIAAGDYHSLALKSDGTVWAWGDNSSGQLGVGATGQTSSRQSKTTETSAAAALLSTALPSQNQSLSGIVDIAAGSLQSFAATAAGDLLGWGSNAVGELGNRPQTVKGNIPLAVADFRFGEDPDHDGLASWKELQLGGNENAYSTVGDTISDAWKALYGLSLVNPTVANQDPTGKGLTILQDYLFGTDPTKFSSVSDGIADGWKVAHGFDPLNADLAAQNLNGQGLTVGAYYQSQSSSANVSTVHDEIPDWWKIQQGLEPGDPTVADRDEEPDGLTNREEYLAGTYPFNSYSDSDTVPDGNDDWPMEGSLAPPRLPPVRYAVIDLGPSRTAEDINNENQVVGTQGERSYGWQKGVETVLNVRAAMRINNVGQVLTESGVLETNGSFTQLKVPSLNNGGLGAPLRAADINDSGTVVGNDWASYSWFFILYPILGQPTEMQFFLPYNALPDMPQYGVSGISNDGSLTGTSQHAATGFPEITLAPGKAIVDRHNAITLIDTLPGFVDTSSGHSILDRNGGAYVLGYSWSFAASASKPFLWHDPETGNSPEAFGTTVIGLPTLEAARHTYPWRMNRRLEIVGWSEFSADGLYINEYVATVWRNGQAIDLNTLVSDSRWHLEVASSINDNGLVVGRGTLSGTEHAFLLVPADMVPDYNRDGKIDDQDRGKVTKANPYRFWINDDNDSGNTGGDDIPGGAPQNGIDTRVNGVRDLIDFFPIYLDVRHVLEVLPTTQFDYTLACDDEFLNYVATDLMPAMTGDYLTRVDSPTNALDAAGSLSNQPVTRLGFHGHRLDVGLLDTIKNDGKGILLVEAWSRIAHPLKLRVTNRQTNQTAAEIALPISIDSVEKMFRHKNLMSADSASGGRADYATGIDSSHQEPENYPDSQCTSKAFVFVHGYNVNPMQARGWNAEIFKRLFWSGSKAKFIGTTWHSAETQYFDVTVNYHINVLHALQTAQGLPGVPGLAAYLNQVGGNITVAAHSLGNMLVSSSISDWDLNVVNYFMLDASLAMESFDDPPAIAEQSENMIHPAWALYPNNVRPSEWFRLFDPSDARSTLTWRGRLQRRQALVYNFYSSGEEVLAEHSNAHSNPAILANTYTLTGLYKGRFAWALQEKLKGRSELNVLGSIYGGWGITENIGNPPHVPSPLEAASLTDASLTTDPVFDPGYKLIRSLPSLEFPDGQITREYREPRWFGDLTDPDKGNATAANHRNTLLAEAIPARSLPIGANPLALLGAASNFDMQVTFKNGWPAERLLANDPSWRHSDVREAAFTYVYPLFTSFVELADLKK